MEKKTVTFFWFRRDLRLTANTGLYHALRSGNPVVPLFIFDSNILDDLEDKKDKRVNFIYEKLKEIHAQLKKFNSSLIIKIGKPNQIWKELITEWNIAEVYANSDYEPYATERDQFLKELFIERNIKFRLYKDQVIFEKNEVTKDNGEPYQVYTPFKNRWLDVFSEEQLAKDNSQDYTDHYYKFSGSKFPGLNEVGFSQIKWDFPDSSIKRNIIINYHKTRDLPAEVNGTSRLGLHLRFGTISIRNLVREVKNLNSVFLSELIWREFFMVILYHFPHVVNSPFKDKYKAIDWINNKNQFQRWCEGNTGYPIVDAGMRELNESGYMHNRVRMITASFLTKHLLIDWRWGERYFAEKLLDYELSSNNGNWQWAAGCGCDAAPYFRIFNPTTQIKKFDPDYRYINKWVPEYMNKNYPSPIVEHKFARERALHVYSQAVKD